MAKIRKRNEEELKKERKNEEELKNQRRIDKAFTLNGVFDKDEESTNIRYRGKDVMRVKVRNTGFSSKVPLPDEFNNLNTEEKIKVNEFADRTIQRIKNNNGWGERKEVPDENEILHGRKFTGDLSKDLKDHPWNPSELVAPGNLLDKPDIKVTVGGKEINGVKEITLDTEGTGNKLKAVKCLSCNGTGAFDGDLMTNGPCPTCGGSGKLIKSIKGRSAKVTIIDDIQTPPIMKGHNPKSATLDSDEIKGLVEHTRGIGLADAVKRVTKNLVDGFKDAWPSLDSLKEIKDGQLAQNQIDAEIKRGERQKAKDKKREGCKKFTVHLVKEKRVSKDYQFDVYHKDRRTIVDVEGPDIKTIMMNDPGDVKYVQAFEKILRIRIDKMFRTGETVPLSFAYRDTIIDEYVLETL